MTGEPTLNSKVFALANLQEYPAGCTRLKCCVIIPTYNNASTLQTVVAHVLEYSRDVIIVNDGCSDGSVAVLEAFGNRIKVLTHRQNMGKGQSLRDAFLYASANDYEYAVTIDSDGQHFASDLPLFFNEIEKSPGTVVIGARNMTQENVPSKSSFGHKFSNFWFRFETGIKLSDTQSGYRLYPLCKMQELQFFTRKFEFEIEVIVKCAWHGIPVKNIPIQIYYAPGKQRVSHFRPFRDFTRVSLINIWFVILALVWYIPRRFLGLLTRENAYKFMRKHIFNSNESTARKAFSIGLGICMGIFPIWGYQMLVAVLLAQILKLNKALVLLAANISLPPFIPIIIYVSYKTGALFMRHPSDEFGFSRAFNLKWVKENIWQYTTGAVALSLIAGMVAWALSYLAIWSYRRKMV